MQTCTHKKEHVETKRLVLKSPKLDRYFYSCAWICTNVCDSGCSNTIYSIMVHKNIIKHRKEIRVVPIERAEKGLQNGY